MGRRAANALSTRARQDHAHESYAGVTPGRVRNPVHASDCACHEKSERFGVRTCRTRAPEPVPLCERSHPQTRDVRHRLLAAFRAPRPCLNVNTQQQYERRPRWAAQRVPASVALRQLPAARPGLRFRPHLPVRRAARTARPPSARTGARAQPYRRVCSEWCPHKPVQALAYTQGALRAVHTH